MGMPEPLTVADIDAVAAVVRAEVGPSVLVDVGLDPELPGELELMVVAAAAGGVMLALTKAGYPNRVRPGPARKATCLCCAARRFDGTPWVGRCDRCAHFFERHVVERMLRALPALPAPQDRASVIVSPRHDLVAYHGGRSCDRCGIIEHGANLMQQCAPAGADR